MGQAQPLAGWCWVLSVVHAQMRPCSYIELRVWRYRTNRRTHYSDMPRTSETHRNTWTDGFGCRHTMLAEYHHCQHLIWKQLDVDPFQKKERKKEEQNFYSNYNNLFLIHFGYSSIFYWKLNKSIKFCFTF